MEKFVVDKNEAGERLDKVIALHFPKYSRTQWQTAIVNRVVLVDKTPANPRHSLRADELVTIDFDTMRTLFEFKFTNVGSIGKLDIIYEDETVLVINKPAGLVTHPSHAHTTDSVVHRLLAYNQSIATAVYDRENPKSRMRPGIVHRLDKDTSGVLIVAKTKTSMSFLAKQIEGRNVSKKYQALLFGHFDHEELSLNTWINRDEHDRRKMRVTENALGREAKTGFKIEKLLQTKKGEWATLVEATPITGRTHQIRVHAAYIHQPVLGDEVYGTHESQLLSKHVGLHRQFLHAGELTIRLPDTKEPRTFKAPLPTDLEKALDQFSTIT